MTSVLIRNLISDVIKIVTNPWISIHTGVSVKKVIKDDQNALAEANELIVSCVIICNPKQIIHKVSIILKAAKGTRNIYKNFCILSLDAVRIVICDLRNNNQNNQP